MTPRAVTQKDIAARLGVSVATVSRALNDQPGVSPEIRGRVLDTARELGYTPNISAQGLATAKMRIVGFVIHEMGLPAAADPFYPFIMHGAEKYLARRGYHILLTTLDDQAMNQEEGLDIVNQRRVDGLILAGPHFSSRFIIKLRNSGVPLILVDNTLEHTPLSCVCSDDEGGAYAAARHLLEHGHRFVVFLSGPEAWSSNNRRIQGYRKALAEAGLKPRVLHESTTTLTTGEQAMRRALDLWPDLTAVCAVNDAMAVGALRAATAHGRRTPDDLAVTGFDDIALARIHDPPLTTVHIFKRQIGALAARYLLDAIEDQAIAPVKTMVATALVVRQSCGCPE